MDTQLSPELTLHQKPGANLGENEFQASTNEDPYEKELELEDHCTQDAAHVGDSEGNNEEHPDSPEQQNLEEQMLKQIQKIQQQHQVENDKVKEDKMSPEMPKISLEKPKISPEKPKMSPEKPKSPGGSSKKRESVIFRVVREVSKEQLKQLKKIEKEQTDMFDLEDQEIETTTKDKAFKKLFHEKEDKVVIQMEPSQLPDISQIYDNRQELLNEVAETNEHDENHDDMFFGHIGFDPNEDDFEHLEPFGADSQQQYSPQAKQDGVITKPDVLISAEDVFLRKPIHAYQQGMMMDKGPVSFVTPLLQEKVSSVGLFKEKTSEQFSLPGQQHYPQPTYSIQAIPDLVPKNDIFQMGPGFHQHESTSTDNILGRFKQFALVDPNRDEIVGSDPLGPFGDLNINPDERFYSDFLMETAQECGIQTAVIDDNNNNQNILVNNNGETSIINGGNQIGFINSEGKMVVVDKNNNQANMDPFIHGEAPMMPINAINNSNQQFGMENPNQVNMSHFNGGMPIYNRNGADYSVGTLPGNSIGAAVGGGNYYVDEDGVGGYADFIDEVYSDDEYFSDSENYYEDFTDYWGNFQQQELQPQQPFKGMNVVPNQGEKIILSSSNSGGGHSVVVSSHVVPSQSSYHQSIPSGRDRLRMQNIGQYKDKEKETYLYHTVPNTVSFAGIASPQNIVPRISPIDAEMGKFSETLTPQERMEIQMMGNFSQPSTSHSWSNPGQQYMISERNPYETVGKKRLNRSYLKGIMGPTCSPDTLHRNADREHAYILAYQNKTKKSAAKARTRYEALIQKVKGKDLETMKEFQEIVNHRTSRKPKNFHNLGQPQHVQFSGMTRHPKTSGTFGRSQMQHPIMMRSHTRRHQGGPNSEMKYQFRKVPNPARVESSKVPSYQQGTRQNDPTQNTTILSKIPIPQLNYSYNPVTENQNLQVLQKLQESSDNVFKPLDIPAPIIKSNSVGETEKRCSTKTSTHCRVSKSSNAVIHISINSAPNSSPEDPEKILNCSINIGDGDDSVVNHEKETMKNNYKETSNYESGDQSKIDGTNAALSGVDCRSEVGKGDNESGIVLPNSVASNQYHNVEYIRSIPGVPEDYGTITSIQPIQPVKSNSAVTSTYEIVNDQIPNNVTKSKSAVDYDNEETDARTERKARRFLCYDNAANNHGLETRGSSRRKYDYLMSMLQSNADFAEAMGYNAEFDEEFDVSYGEDDDYIDHEIDADSNEDEERHRFQDQEYVTSFIKSFQNNPRRYKVYPEAQKYKKVSKQRDMSSMAKRRRDYAQMRASQLVKQQRGLHSQYVDMAQENKQPPVRSEALMDNNQPEKQESEADSDLDTSFGDPAQLATSVTSLTFGKTIKKPGNKQQPKKYELPRISEHHYGYPPPERAKVTMKMKNTNDGEDGEGQVKKLLAYIRELNTEVHNMNTPNSANTEVKVEAGNDPIKKKYKKPLKHKICYKHFMKRPKPIKPLDLSRKPKRRPKRKLVKTSSADTSSVNTTNSTTTGSSSTNTSSITTPGNLTSPDIMHGRNHNVSTPGNDNNSTPASNESKSSGSYSNFTPGSVESKTSGSSFTPGSVQSKRSDGDSSSNYSTPRRMFEMNSLEDSPVEVNGIGLMSPPAGKTSSSGNKNRIPESSKRDFCKKKASAESPDRKSKLGSFGGGKAESNSNSPDDSVIQMARMAKEVLNFAKLSRVSNVNQHYQSSNSSSQASECSDTTATASDIADSPVCDKKKKRPRKTHNFPHCKQAKQKRRIADVQGSKSKKLQPSSSSQSVTAHNTQQGKRNQRKTSESEKSTSNNSKSMGKEKPIVKHDRMDETETTPRKSCRSRPKQINSPAVASDKEIMSPLKKKRAGDEEIMSPPKKKGRLQSPKAVSAASPLLGHDKEDIETTPIKRARGRPKKGQGESSPNIPFINLQNSPVNLSIVKGKKNFLMKNDKSNNDDDTEMLTSQEFRRRFHNRMQNAAEDQNANNNNVDDFSGDLDSLLVAASNSDSGFTVAQVTDMSQVDDKCMLILTCDNEDFDSRGSENFDSDIKKNLRSSKK